MLPLWFTSVCLLESFVNVPVTVSTIHGSAIVKVLRAQYGFDLEGPGVAGTDELHRTNEGKAIGIVEIGLELCRVTDRAVPRSLHELLLPVNDGTTFAKEMLHMSMQPKENRDALIGLSWAFMELHEAMCTMAVDVLSSDSMSALQGIAKRERDGLMICLRETELDEERQASIKTGCDIGRANIMASFETS